MEEGHMQGQGRENSQEAYSHHTYISEHATRPGWPQPPAPQMQNAQSPDSEAENKRRIQELEAEVQALKAREKKLEHDISVFKQVFEHLKKQFENIQKKYK